MAARTIRVRKEDANLTIARLRQEGKVMGAVRKKLTQDGKYYDLVYNSPINTNVTHNNRYGTGQTSLMTRVTPDLNISSDILDIAERTLPSGFEMRVVNNILGSLLVRVPAIGKIGILANVAGHAINFLTDTNVYWQYISEPIQQPEVTDTNVDIIQDINRYTEFDALHIANLTLGYNASTVPAQMMMSGMFTIPGIPLPDIDIPRFDFDIPRFDSEDEEEEYEEIEYVPTFFTPSMSSVFIEIEQPEEPDPIIVEPPTLPEPPAPTSREAPQRYTNAPTPREAPPSITPPDLPTPAAITGTEDCYYARILYSMFRDASDFLAITEIGRTAQAIHDVPRFTRMESENRWSRDIQRGIIEDSSTYFRHANRYTDGNGVQLTINRWARKINDANSYEELFREVYDVLVGCIEGFETPMWEGNQQGVVAPEYAGDIVVRPALQSVPHNISLEDFTHLVRRFVSNESLDRYATRINSGRSGTVILAQQMLDDKISRVLVNVFSHMINIEMQLGRDINTAIRNATSREMARDIGNALSFILIEHNIMPNTAQSVGAVRRMVYNTAQVVVSDIDIPRMEVYLRGGLPRDRAIYNTVNNLLDTISNITMFTS